MGTIKVVSKKFEDNEDLGARELEFETPEVLEASSLGELVTIMEEDFCKNQIRAQLKIMFRSYVRTKMDATNDDDTEFTNSDESLVELVLTDWKPEGRVRQTAEEKAIALLGKLDPEVRKLVLAQAQADADAA